MAASTDEEVYQALASCERCDNYFPRDLYRERPRIYTYRPAMYHCSICHLDFAFQGMKAVDMLLLPPCGHSTHDYQHR